jgi:hypothetical protein
MVAGHHYRCHEVVIDSVTNRQSRTIGDSVQPRSEISIEFLKSVQLSFNFISKERLQSRYFAEEPVVFIAQAREFCFVVGLLSFQLL